MWTNTKALEWLNSEIRSELFRGVIQMLARRLSCFKNARRQMNTIVVTQLLVLGWDHSTKKIILIGDI